MSSWIWDPDSDDWQERPQNPEEDRSEIFPVAPTSRNTNPFPGSSLKSVDTDYCCSTKPGTCKTRGTGSISSASGSIQPPETGASLLVGSLITAPSRATTLPRTALLFELPEDHMKLLLRKRIRLPSQKDFPSGTTAIKLWNDIMSEYSAHTYPRFTKGAEQHISWFTIPNKQYVRFALHSNSRQPTYSDWNYLMVVDLGKWYTMVAGLREQRFHSAIKKDDKGNDEAYVLKLTQIDAVDVGSPAACTNTKEYCSPGATLSRIVYEIS